MPIKLEYLRQNDIATVAACIPSLGETEITMSQLHYPGLVNSAFYYTFQQVEKLENSVNYINQGNAIQTAAGVWFMSIESYINSILRIGCLAEKISFEAFKKKEIGQRLILLFNILQIDRTPFYKQTIPKLEEFKRFRNELFHDRTSSTPLKFKKTLFNGNPFFANQIDAMQAAVISLEVFEAFRHVIPRLDLMPNVFVEKDDSFYFEKVDLLFNELLKPFFEKALTKHSLTSDLNLTIPKSNLAESSIFNTKPVEIMIKAENTKTHPVKPSSSKTQIGKDLFDSIKQNSPPIPQGNFQTGSYYRLGTQK